MRKYDGIYENVQCARPGIPPARTHPAERAARCTETLAPGVSPLDGALLSTSRARELEKRQHSHCLEYQAAVEEEWNRPACADAKAAQSTVKGNSMPQSNRHRVVLLLLRKPYINLCTGTTLVAQRLKICLEMQGTRVQALAGELRSHIPRSCNRWAHAFWSRSPQLESPCPLWKILHATAKTWQSQRNKVKFPRTYVCIWTHTHIGKT